ncbi:MAG: tonB-system energizer ExbB [Rhizobiales bacterium PAR1]|nr:MAG: tonB-system energizer ExbB [Rhizobiales bacterium PAR1]
MTRLVKSCLPVVLADLLSILPATAAGTGATLPSALSPLSMFLQADLPVKIVMAGLALASVVAWTVLIAKKIEIARAARTLSRGLAALAGASGLAEAQRTLRSRDRISAALIEAARDEALRGARADKEGVKERMSLRFGRIEAAAAREIARGVSLLATIGATAPFVGLFGTVWGIMNSFIGISKAQTTNLAVVAPGIAEALLATAIGLVAAIPAVIFYNYLVRQVAGYRAVLGDTVATISVIAGRELDHIPALHRAAE